SSNGGSAIYNFDGAVTVSDSVISGNGSRERQTAGGILNQASDRDATVRLVNSTIAYNTTTSTDRTGSQIYTGRRFAGTTLQATVRFRNTIVVGGGERPNFLADGGGTFISEGHNLSNDDSGGLDPALGDLPSTEPLLGPLQDNGGPTWTHALLPGS